MTAMSLDGSDPAGWDPNLDALVAAPGNHRLLYEDDAIRVLSVSVAPGEKEPVHHHRWPSVFVIDRLVKLRDFDGEGRENPAAHPRAVRAAADREAAAAAAAFRAQRGYGGIPRHPHRIQAGLSCQRPVAPGAGPPPVSIEPTRSHQWMGERSGLAQSR